MNAKPIFVVAGVGLSTWLLYRLYSLSLLSSGVSVRTELSGRPELTNFSILPPNADLNIYFDAIITSPQRTRHTASHPYLQLFDQNNQRIATSVPENRTHEISLGINRIEKIKIATTLRNFLNVLNVSTDTLESIWNIIKNTNLSQQEKSQQIYAVLYELLEGKEFTVKTQYKIDGVDIEDTQTIKIA